MNNNPTGRNQYTIGMSPRRFLRFAAPFGHQGGPAKDVAKVRALAAVKSRLPNPTLTIKMNAQGKYQVGLHDGRHRASAAILKGQKVMLVNISPSKSLARGYPGISAKSLVAKVRSSGLLGEYSSGRRVHKL